MASRNFSRKQSLEKEIKEIYAEVSIGASGAPTLEDGLGVASIERDSAGVYILTLEDKYTRLMSMSVTQLAAAAQDINIQMEAEDVSSAKTVTFRCLAAAVETDPSEDSKLYIKMDLKNTSVRP